MNDNWPHKILEELLNHHSSETTYLNEFIISNLNISPSDKLKLSKLQEIFERLELKNLLRWKIEKNHPNTAITMEKEFLVSYAHHKRDFGKSINGVDETLENNILSAQLTIDGLDYALKLKREREQHESIILTNKISRRSNIWTPVILIATVIISILALYIQLKSQKSGESKPQEEQEKVRIEESKPKNQQDHLSFPSKKETFQDSVK